MSHTFHIPVLGLGFSIDTPLKVARFGISSVISIVDDELVERMRKYHLEKNDAIYTPINKKEDDSRAKRITAYLNMLHDLVNKQFDELKQQSFERGSELVKYFELLPESSNLKKHYQIMTQTEDTAEKRQLQEALRKQLVMGKIDVNIMSKVDKMNLNANGENLGDIYTDALAALRGFANSDLDSSVILSAGMNPRLYSYLESFKDFFPDANGHLKKRIVLKVSDFRSALIQAKFLAKKGLWVSEFRIESGLNCGGHAFATEGYLLGPILDEFKQKRPEMLAELLAIYTAALSNKGINNVTAPALKISVQGGIGTAQEDEFLRNYYQVDATGWGSPFLLVPEATNVDDETLTSLAEATSDDFYLSNASPLGVLFNNFKKSSAEAQRLDRIKKDRPGSPCTKKYLCTNTEFTTEPICTASRQYQNLKLEQLKSAKLQPEAYQEKFEEVTQKTCLCQGLCTSTYIKNNMLKPKENKAVSICPGPNLAYFSRVYSLEEMVKHIYGKLSLIDMKSRSDMFINELKLYVDYFHREVKNSLNLESEKNKKKLQNFKEQLLSGIGYYKGIIPHISTALAVHANELLKQLEVFEQKLKPIATV